MGHLDSVLTVVLSCAANSRARVLLAPLDWCGESLQRVLPLLCPLRMTNETEMDDGAMDADAVETNLPVKE